MSETTKTYSGISFKMIDCEEEVGKQWFRAELINGKGQFSGTDPDKVEKDMRRHIRRINHYNNN